MKLKQIADKEVMKQKIKDLRVKIDGLAQLTKGLRPQSQYQVDISALPDNMSLEEVVKPFEETGYAVSEFKDIIKPIPQQFEEIRDAHKSLLKGKAWLGKVLGALGTESPYPKDGTRKTVEDIEPTADVAKNLTINVDGGWEELNHVERVDWLRQEISTVVKVIVGFDYKELPTRELAIARTNCYTYLSEARFWLGFELQRIKEENK